MSASPVYRIMIAGGGTGGHIFPALAIAAALQAAADVEFLFVGALGKMEMTKVPEAGYHIEGLPIAGLNRSNLLANWKLPFLIIKSFLKVRRLIDTFRPDAVIGVGGYSSFPVLRYAQTQGIPTFIHESNSFAGRANQMLAQKATTIFTGGPGMEKFFPAAKIIVTGNPVRQGLTTAAPSAAEARIAFGLRPDRFTILSVGGSLGADSINQAWQEQLPALQQAGGQLIWQTGSLKYEQYKHLHNPSAGVVVTDFISDMKQAYAAADLVVSRSGAMAVAELALLCKPAILVPYPHAAEDHQTANAKLLSNAGAAITLPDAAVKTELMKQIGPLMAYPSQLQDMAGRLSPFAHPDAASVIAAQILKTIKQSS